MENVYSLVFEFWNQLIGGIEFFNVEFINALSVISIVAFIIGIFVFIKKFISLIMGGTKSWF